MRAERQHLEEQISRQLRFELLRCVSHAIDLAFCIAGYPVSFVSGSNSQGVLAGDNRETMDFVPIGCVPIGDATSFDAVRK